jgi:lactoylglutathione lyase
MFTQAFPMLSVADLERSLRFYRDGVGFSVAYTFPDEGEPVFVGLELDGSQLGIGRSEDGGPSAASAGERFELCVYADDCDAAVAHLRALDVEVLAEPADQPWGERMARVADPDGNPIAIMQRLE